MHVIFDDDLHADAHMRGDRQDEQQHDHGDQRRAEDLHHCGMIATEQTHHDEHEGDDQRHVGDCGEALAPELLGAGSGRAQAEHPPERRAHLARNHQRDPPMNR